MLLRALIPAVLAVILSAAAATKTVAWGAALLILYSLGLGLPFIAIALGLDHARNSMAWLRRHGRHVEMFGAPCSSALASCS